MLIDRGLRFGEEPHLAYNRVGLSTYWEKKDPETLYLNPLDWYKSHAPGKLTFHTSDPVTESEYFISVESILC